MLSSDPAIETIESTGTMGVVLNTLKHHSVDILLSDIKKAPEEMIEFATAAGKTTRPYLIYTSHQADHAVAAFDRQADDFLLKPISQERLSQAIDRAQRHIEKTKAAKQNEPLNRFEAHSGNRTSYIAPDDIDWVEAAGNYVSLHVGEQQWMLRSTMSHFENLICNGAPFLRVSRSAIVNLRKVSQLIRINPKKKHIMLSSGQTIPLTIPTKELTDRIAISTDLRS